MNKKAFTLAEVFHPIGKSQIFAFTLAEVLVTLGIIGIVAALTIPVLTANYRKKNVITHLKKFQTTINQAIKLAEVENGEISEWDRSEQFNGDSMYNIWNKYMQKYFTDTKVKKYPDGISVNLPDSSMMLLYDPSNMAYGGLSSTHIYYCINEKACNKLIAENENKIYGAPCDGKTTFLFSYKSSKKTFSPYYYEADGEKTRENLLDRTTYGCNQSKKFYCASLIEFDGWEITNTYPIKF